MGYSVWVRKNEGTGQYHGVVTNGRFVNSLVMHKTVGFADRGAAYTAGVNWRNEQAAMNRERKAKVDGKRMHCQCCGRAILANLGSIAHHGYERPGSGWQTASCFGAKRLPWEVDRSAVADLIKFLKASLEGQIKSRENVANESVEISCSYEVREKAFAKPTLKWLKISRSNFAEMKANPEHAIYFQRSSLYDFDKIGRAHV